MGEKERERERERESARATERRREREKEGGRERCSKTDAAAFLGGCGVRAYVCVMVIFLKHV